MDREHGPKHYKLKNLVLIVTTYPRQCWYRNSSTNWMQLPFQVSFIENFSLQFISSFHIHQRWKMSSRWSGSSAPPPSMGHFDSWVGLPTCQLADITMMPGDPSSKEIIGSALSSVLPVPSFAARLELKLGCKESLQSAPNGWFVLSAADSNRICNQR